MFHFINAIMFIHVAMMYMFHAMYCEYCHTHIYVLHWLYCGHATLVKESCVG